ncbi:hypothetical protein R3P38DRAFT_3265845 [Favolaschia claudopus]|uniref:Uncharacterized protein n=1 Tax=Favolaschia claudopus TaxID=2862362 RepID=A0AAW0C0F9_9AGAR
MNTIETIAGLPLNENGRESPPKPPESHTDAVVQTVSDNERHFAVSRQKLPSGPDGMRSALAAFKVKAQDFFFTGVGRGQPPVTCWQPPYDVAALQCMPSEPSGGFWWLITNSLFIHCWLKYHIGWFKLLKQASQVFSDNNRSKLLSNSF